MQHYLTAAFMVMEIRSMLELLAFHRADSLVMLQGLRATEHPKDDTSPFKWLRSKRQETPAQQEQESS